MYCTAVHFYINKNFTQNSKIIFCSYTGKFRDLGFWGFFLCYALRDSL